jgi:hypothetical protein
VARITEELRRLDREEELAEELLLERRRKQEEQLRRQEKQIRQSQRDMDEAFNRLLRLRRMKRQLRDKGVEMARRDFASVEEMEEADRREEEAREAELERVRQQEAQALAQVQAACSHEAVDWSGFNLDPSLSDILGLVAQGSSGDTGATTGGSSSNV